MSDVRSLIEKAAAKETGGKKDDLKSLLDNVDGAFSDEADAFARRYQEVVRRKLNNDDIFTPAETEKLLNKFEEELAIRQQNANYLLIMAEPTQKDDPHTKEIFRRFFSDNLTIKDEIKNEIEAGLKDQRAKKYNNVVGELTDRLKQHTIELKNAGKPYFEAKYNQKEKSDAEKNRFIAIRDFLFGKEDTSLTVSTVEKKAAEVKIIYEDENTSKEDKDKALVERFSLYRDAIKNSLNSLNDVREGASNRQHIQLDRHPMAGKFLTAAALVSSAVLVVPGLIAAAYSKVKYNTAKFWSKSASHSVKFEKDIAKVEQKLNIHKPGK